jgi:hypothetical protein
VKADPVLPPAAQCGSVRKAGVHRRTEQCLVEIEDERRINGVLTAGALEDLDLTRLCSYTHRRVKSSISATLAMTHMREDMALVGRLPDLASGFLPIAAGPLGRFRTKPIPLCSHDPARDSHRSTGTFVVARADKALQQRMVIAP